MPRKAPHYVRAQRPLRVAKQFVLRSPLVIALWTGLSSGQQAPAQLRPSNVDVARSIAVSGRAAYEARDYPTAVMMFRQAYALFQAPTLVLYEARALRESGQLVEASRVYHRAAKLQIAPNAPEQFAQAIAAAKEEADELDASIPTLTISLAGAEATEPGLRIEQNGTSISPGQIDVPQRLDPGDYRVEASLGPHRMAQVDERLAVREHKTLVLNLSAPQPTVAVESPSSALPPVTDNQSTPTLLYVAAGIGVAGMGAGVVVGLLASNEYDTASSLCDTQCATDSLGATAVNDFRTLRTVSSVAYGLGAAGAAGSLLVWLATKNESLHEASLQPWISPRAAGVRGRF